MEQTKGRNQIQINGDDCSGGLEIDEGDDLSVRI